MTDNLTKKTQPDTDDDLLDLEIIEIGTGNSIDTDIDNDADDDFDDYFTIEDVDEAYKNLKQNSADVKKTSISDEDVINALRRKKRIKDIINFVEIFAVALVLAYIISFHVIVNATIPTGSMSNTILPGDRVIGMRLAYLFGKPERGDIIIFKFPDNEEEIYIKRIIGLPGETVEIRSGRLYVNDELYIEDYINEPMNDYSYGPYHVPQNCYFVLGDNRNHSIDSRFWNNTFVHKDKILGKAVFKYWKNFKFLD